MQRQIKAALKAALLFLAQGTLGLALWGALVVAVYEPPRPKTPVVYRCGKAYPLNAPIPRVKCAAVR